MGAPVPALETVIAAVKTRMETVAGIGTVVAYDHTFEDPAEFYEAYQDVNFEMDLWVIDVLPSDEIEGEAIGEVYEQYNLRIRYWSIRVNTPAWSQEARTLAENVRTELSGNAAVFAISGQRQLRTPETVSLSDHGQREIGGQMLYETELRLQVEARRWS